MLIDATQQHIDKIEEALLSPYDLYDNISQLSGKVVIFKDGEVFSGGVAMLVYDTNNILLDYFPDEEFEKVLVS
jgi:hypothetical protein